MNQPKSIPKLTLDDYDVIMHTPSRTTALALNDMENFHNNFREHLTLEERSNHEEVVKKAFGDLYAMLTLQAQQASLSPDQMRQVKNLIQKAIASVPASGSTPRHFAYEPVHMVQTATFLNALTRR